MNAVEIYEKASWDVEHNKITLGEFEERIKTLYDVEPVRHGHWEQDGHHIRCSECGTYFCITDREGDSFPINYCPCCGAKMDKKEQKHE